MTVPGIAANGTDCASATASGSRKAASPIAAQRAIRASVGALRDDDTGVQSSLGESESGESGLADVGAAVACRLDEPDGADHGTVSSSGASTTPARTGPAQSRRPRYFTNASAAAASAAASTPAPSADKSAGCSAKNPQAAAPPAS